MKLSASPKLSTTKISTVFESDLRLEFSHTLFQEALYFYSLSLPCGNSLRHCSSTGSENSVFLFLEWFISGTPGRAVASGLLSLLLWNLHSMSELGWEWSGSQYSQPAVPSLESLSYDWWLSSLLREESREDPDSLAEITCSLASDMWNWEGMRNIDGLAINISIFLRDTVVLDCELEWSFSHIEQGVGRNVAGHGSSATNSHCAYQYLDFLE